MSGPSTRSHRSSVRGVETTLVELAELLKANKTVVMITGAGLSAASGIPTFRGGSDSVWSVTAAAQGRRSMFRRDPLRWYNEFFLRQFPMSFTRKTPNAGHEAIAALAREFPELRVITQNIDGLHQDTVNAWPDPLRLIEAHGRLGLFKCIAESDRGKGNGSDGSDTKVNDEDDDEMMEAEENARQEGEDEQGGEQEDDHCPYSYDRDIKPEDFPESVRVTLEDDAQNAAARGLGRSLAEIPRCPGCGEASSPMSLLFDEDYDSHSFYDFEKAEDWFKEADAVVFVGTSFAVTLTSLAIREAKRRSVPVFDFNVSVSLKASPALNAKTILGRAEATLPALARAAGVSVAPAPAAAAAASPVTPAAAARSRPAAAAAAMTAVVEHTNGGGSGSSSGGISGSTTSSSPSSGRSSPMEDLTAAREEPSGETTTKGGGDSPLGRRAREESLGGGGGGGGSTSSGGSTGNGADATAGKEKNEQLPDAKRVKGARSHVAGVGGVSGGADAVTGGPIVPAAASSTPEELAWGGGAAFLLEPALETPLRKDQVRVELDEAYSRKSHPDPEVEANVEALWAEQLSKNPLLFNGSKFRLAGYSTEGDHTATAAAAAAATPSPPSPADSTDTSERGSSGGGLTTPPPPPRSRSPTSPPTRRLRLRLGLTDYRTFRGTNWSPSAARLAADSAHDHPWLEGAYLSQKLGVGAVVETADGFLLSLCRSSGVAEGQGMIDAPGGHPEPENLGLTAEVLRDLSGKTASSRRKLGHQAVDELFSSAVNEVVDETNVPRSSLGEPLLSGVVRQGNSFGAPSAAFIIPCSLGRAEVSALYARGANEAFESTGLRTIPAAEVLAEGGSAWFAKRGLRATPSFQGALELWREHRLLGRSVGVV